MAQCSFCGQPLSFWQTLNGKTIHDPCAQRVIARKNVERAMRAGEPVLPQKINLRCRHVDASIGDCSTAPKIKALFESAQRERKLDEDYHPLKNLLIVTPFSWPAFPEWDARFRELCFEPRNWADPAALTIPPEHEPFLAAARSASEEVLALSIEVPYPMPKSRFISKYGQRSLDSLAGAGAVKVVRSVFEKLPMVPLEHLRGIQKHLGIKGGRSRKEAAGRIQAATTEDCLSELLLPEYREDFIVVNSPLERVGSDFIQNRKRMVALLLTTMSRFLINAQQLAMSMHIWRRWLVQAAATECPICRPLDGTGVDVSGGEIPPFHPGCICSVMPAELWQRLHAQAREVVRRPTP